MENNKKMKNVVSDIKECVKEIYKAKKREEKKQPPKLFNPLLEYKPIGKKNKTQEEREIEERERREKEFAEALGELIKERIVDPEKICEELTPRAIRLDITRKSDVKDMILLSTKGECLFAFNCKFSKPTCECNIKRNKKWLTSPDNLSYTNKIKQK